MVQQLIGQAIVDPFTHAQNSKSMIESRSARDEMMPLNYSLRQQGLQLRGQIANARMEQMREAAKQRSKMFDQSMGLKRKQLELLQQKLEAAKSGKASGDMGSGNHGITPTQEARLKYTSGMPYQRQTDSGEIGTFKFPTGAQNTSNEKAISAFPQLANAMKQIANGVKYSATSPGQSEKTMDAISAYFLGGASPKQMDVLNKAGIADRSLAIAVETAASVMRVPPTNEGMHQVLSIFIPKKGDTPQTYSTQLQNIFSELESRYWSSIYDSKNGIPLDDSGIADKDSFVKNELSQQKFGTIGEGASSPSTNQPNQGPSSFDDKVRFLVSQHPQMTEEDAARYLKAHGVS